MQINEYIQKNLSSLNFNVLSSIYEENGLELTEEIKSYLKETPENTNLAIIGQLSRSGDNFPKIISITSNNGGWIFAEDSDFKTFSELRNFINTYKYKFDDYQYRISTEILQLKNFPDEGRCSVNNEEWNWFVGTEVTEINLTQETIRCYDDN